MGSASSARALRLKIVAMLLSQLFTWSGESQIVLPPSAEP
jgi:hypothetical protein